MNTVESLRKNGYKVRVQHFRPIYSKLDEDEAARKYDGGLIPYSRKSRVKPPIYSKGGKTIVEITSPEGVEMKGEAICSDKDVFSYKLGVKVALGRALASEEDALMLNDLNLYGEQ